MKNLVVTNTGNTEFRLGERVQVLSEAHPLYPSKIAKRTGAILAQSVKRPEQIWLVEPSQCAEQGPKEYDLDRLRAKLKRLQKSGKQTISLSQGNLNALLMIMEDYYDRIDHA